MRYAPADFAEIRQNNFTYLLFGTKIANSKAPALHNFLFRKQGLGGHNYQILESSDVEGFVELISANNKARAKCAADLAYNGSAVTLPHKVVMVDHVDVVDDNAKAVGAINTIYVRFDHQKNPLNVGTNTDTIGIRDAFVFRSKDVVQENLRSGRPGLVYGGGGASRAAVYALHTYLGCPQVYVVNRFEHEIVELMAAMKRNGFTGEIIPVTSIEQARQLSRPHLAVLSVPDVPPHTPQEKHAREILGVFMETPGHVIEMCYYPSVKTALYKDFEAAGWHVILGVEPMIYQGIAQQALWTGYDASHLDVEDARKHVYNWLGLL